MKREDVVIFEAEFCEPNEKAGRERELQQILEQVSQQPGNLFTFCSRRFSKFIHNTEPNDLAKSSLICLLKFEINEFQIGPVRSLRLPNDCLASIFRLCQ